MSRVNEEKIYCPVNGWDCPYFRDGGECGMMEDEGCGPLGECDDYDFFFGDDGMFPDEPDDIDDDCGYDPYMGCFTDDC